MTGLDFFNKGFTDLIPIRAGDKRPTGRWAEVEADKEMVSRWVENGRNIGLKTARFPTLDVDVLDNELARTIREMVYGYFGKAVPCRVGQAPKCAYVFRLKGGNFPKRYIQIVRGEERYRIEFLAGGQYVVIAGMHPSGTPYLWDSAPVAGELPEVGEAEADELLDLAADAAVKHGYEIVGRRALASASDAPPQESLEGSVADVSKFLSIIPNDLSDRNEYLRVGFAIKAALPRYPEEAFRLWHEWCLRWTLGHNDEETILRDWEGLKGPYRVGIDFLRHLAQQSGYVAAQDIFEPLEDLPEGAPAEQLSPYTDAWLAGDFVARHKNEFRYCDETRKWLRWDGVRWVPGSLQEAQNAMAVLAREASHRAAKSEHRKWALSLRAVQNGTSYAAFSPDLQVKLAELDSNPWILNTPGGVVDLRTGDILPPDPALLCTRSTAVAPVRSKDGPPPKWKAFLRDATGGDKALVAYLQRLAGYALTGLTTEQSFVFIWGPGGNGKGVFLNTLVRLYGEYAAVAPMGTFVSSYGDRHPTEIAGLAGARMVTAQETEEGRSWDEAKVKSITGGDPISARFMRGDFFVFQPTFKLIFAGNHRPHTKNLDPAMRRRLHLVPFTLQPPKVNPHLQEELLAELPGILWWAIEGCLAWQQQGLNPPTSVIEETQSYFHDEDLLGRWLEERTVPGKDLTSTTDLYSDWCRWCGAVGEQYGSMKSFSSAMRNHGLEQVRSRAARGFRVTLSSAAKSPPSTSLGGPLTLDDLLRDDAAPLH